MPPIEAFHRLDAITKQEKEAANVRVFEGDGSHILRVPGLVTLEGVRVGPQSIPLTEDIEVPVDPQHSRKEIQSVSLVKLEVTPDGEEVLLRSLLSNDGLWQAGAKIYVAGEWAKEKKSTPTPKSEPETDPYGGQGNGE